MSLSKIILGIWVVTLTAGAQALPVVHLGAGTPMGSVDLGLDLNNTGSPISYYHLGDMEKLGAEGIPAPANPLKGLAPSDNDGDGYPDDVESNLASNPNDAGRTPIDANGDGRVSNSNVSGLRDSDGDGYPDSVEAFRGGDPDDPKQNPMDNSRTGKNDFFEQDADRDGFVDDIEGNFASNPHDRESTPIDPNGDDQPG